MRLPRRYAPRNDIFLKNLFYKLEFERRNDEKVVFGAFFAYVGEGNGAPGQSPAAPGKPAAEPGK